jgi:hypothetical protein
MHTGISPYKPGADASERVQAQKKHDLDDSSAFISSLPFLYV